jgi:hypothetical protein
MAKETKPEEVVQVKPRPVQITMEDVDVVRRLNPDFNNQLTIAATSRTRAYNTVARQVIEGESDDNAS